ncbi:porin [Rhodobacter maris]|uniref:Outer membrane protein OmpU n=1 Tax=Rhodobacter maris TaxID=446682 RepID=A0A285RRV9_9RHOB|nr:porin [Rhodobacter maris]SOB95057.1 outer membrane protein OmpU [Rhodobacter maris]
MKKLLIASTALVLTAGAAAADISISGYGRFGLGYTSADVNPMGGAASTWVEQRLRLNIVASTTSDMGVEFGAKMRMQYDDSNTMVAGNRAQFFVSYEGFYAQVGNITTALDEDTAGLFYATEIGLTDTGFGDSRSDFFAYESKAGNGNKVGVYGKYTISGVTLEASFINPDHYDLNGVVAGSVANDKTETSFVASYEGGPITVAAGATWNGAGIDGNDVWYLGGKYAFNDAFSAGLTYINEGESALVDLGSTTSIYGTYTVGAMGVTAYVAQIDNYDTAAPKSDTSFGIGASYDLGGGVKLLGAVHRDYDEETFAEAGVKFAF